MRALVADDHPLYIEAATTTLERLFSGAEIVSAGSLDAILEAIAAKGPFELILVDYAMPGVGGPEAIGRIVLAAGSCPVAVMSGIASRIDVASCIGAGARGFLPKTLGGPLFAGALNLVMLGGTYVPADFASTDAASSRTKPFERELSDREMDVLELLVEGASNKEIARKLEIQEVTVKLHASRIFSKLGAKNRSQAAVKALEANLLRR